MASSWLRLPLSPQAARCRFTADDFLDAACGRATCIADALKKYLPDWAKAHLPFELGPIDMWLPPELRDHPDEVPQLPTAHGPLPVPHSPLPTAHCP